MQLFHLFVTFRAVSAGRHRQPVIAEIPHVEKCREVDVDVLRCEDEKELIPNTVHKHLVKSVVQQVRRWL